MNRPNHCPWVVGIAVAAIAVTCMAQQVGPGAGRGGSGGRGPQSPPLLITIPGFADGSALPVKFSCSGQPAAVSPEIHWSQVPAGTQSFMLLVHDPEPHPGKGIMDITHWLIWNIPGSATGLPEGVPAGSTLPDGSHQVKGTRPTGSYAGPCAPPGPNHHYTWELYALDTKLDLPEDASRADIMKAADGHVLGAALWIGLFHR